ncbi:MAG: hypothetical protein WC280_03590 [Patescibacteria group bacterium]
MDLLVNFFNHPFFIIIGGVSVVIIVISFLYSLYLIIRGIIPVWYRLGKGLARRNIAIFAEAEEFNSLKAMLVDSKLFKPKNIHQIQINNIKKADNYTVFLVHWSKYKNNINDIVTMKKDSTALVIYSPQNEGMIDSENLNLINSHRNSIIVNFRGRLINDIFVSLITTVYSK